MKMIPEVDRYLPLHVILGRPVGANAWQGRIEHSFSMGWSTDRVRLWWSGKAYSILGEHTISGQKDAEFNAEAISPQGWEIKIFDLSSDECPIDIDLHRWLADMARGRDRKFENRNPEFTMAGDDSAVERAA